MTQNLYLGADLAPALTAATPADFVAAVASVHAGLLATDFPRRAAGVADIVAAERPALVALQEVADWTLPPGPGTATPGQDFLTDLQAGLAARDLDYRVAAVSHNARVGPLPLGAGHVALRVRDVILVDARAPGLIVQGARSGRFTTQESLVLMGVPVSFDRGWALVDATLVGRPFRFVVTHLEVELFSSTQLAQARELLGGPAAGRSDSPGAMVVAGDFNAAPGTPTYAALVEQLADSWTVNGDDPGPTYGRDGALADLGSRLDTRLDLVLTSRQVRTLASVRVGVDPMTGATSPPWWSSDHAGVLATLALD